MSDTDFPGAAGALLWAFVMIIVALSVPVPSIIDNGWVRFLIGGIGWAVVALPYVKWACRRNERYQRMAEMPGRGD